MPARLFVTLQYLLPRYAMTRLVYRLARIRMRAVKDFLIRAFVRLYDVNLDEAAGRTPVDFASLNDFFTRELVPGMRPVDAAPAAIVSPVDGIVSAAGRMDDNVVFQAKGIAYTLEELLAVDLDEARAYRDGCYATLYLAPHMYHRVHMPLDGELVAAHYVPGDLFSVNAATVARLHGLFRRNERLNLHFRTEHGPMAVILVGALNVGSITTPWTGEIRPARRGVVEVRELGPAPRRLARGDLLGWFNMGSTVIVLLPPGVAEWSPELTARHATRMGSAIGRLTGA